ncbi:hypothetical protein PAPYR_6017 [Paratrimastix pyriformis]|uniref:Uncharacterized protein n=1 Tax=Paratrimastix pyriformis TaxID=342808 RepID=A0ABQ8ULG6_9EUKA|nr:hypothetical protein PAPYR_13061 [Paratrimastix pyriformis]KAJ4458330.1 hypothetical protein PAPYR_6017 [Paratrimastix pyriformis]
MGHRYLAAQCCSLLLFEPCNLQQCYLTVDVTPFPIENPAQNPALYWSGFYHLFGLKYEMICSSTTGECLRVRGPFFGSRADITIFRLDPPALVEKRG